MKSVTIIICLFFVSLICGCSTTKCQPQKVSHADLRAIEKGNEDLMSGLDGYLKELDELRTISLRIASLQASLRDRKLVDRKLEEFHCRRLSDVQELRDKIEKYENDLAAEKEYYELLKSGPF